MKYSLHPATRHSINFGESYVNNIFFEIKNMLCNIPGQSIYVPFYHIRLMGLVFLLSYLMRQT